MSWIFYYNFILQSILGAILIINGIDDHYIINKIQYNSTRLLGYYAIMYSIVAFPIGMLLSNAIFKQKKISLAFYNYTHKKIHKEVRYNDSIVKMLLVLLSVICILSVFYVLYTIGNIPLFSLFSGSNTLELAGFRGDMTRHFPGNEYIKNIIALGLTPLLSYISYAYKKLDNTTFNKLWFTTMFICSILIVTYSLSKSPLIVYLLSFIFMKVYLDGSISKKTIAIGGIGALTIIIFLYVFISKDINIATLFRYNSGIFGRIMLSQVSGTFLSFDIFPNSVEHLGFSSISGFLSDILNLNYSERSARILMEYINAGGVEAGTAGVVNSLFIGEAWANFGIIGLVLSPIYVGFVIQSLYLFFLNSPKTPFFVGLFVTYSMSSRVTGGFNDYIYNIDIITKLILILVIYGFASILNSTLNVTKKLNLYKFSN